MNSFEFYKKVREMRRLQKEFFRTRDKGIQAEALVAEQDIDNEITRISQYSDEQLRICYEKRQIMLDMVRELDLTPKL